MVKKILQFKHRFLYFYQHHEVLVSMIFFALGFIFDILTLGRIDDLLNLVQQALYLFILGTLLMMEIKVTMGKLVISERFKMYWNYHNLIVHFLFGSLLSLYTLFYLLLLDFHC